MNNDRTDHLLNQILSGILIFYYKDKEYVLRPPDHILKYKSGILYNKIINDEKYSDWIREANMSKVMIKLGIWEKDSDKTIKSLEQKIEDNKLKLYESIKRPDVSKLIRKTLASTRNTLGRLMGIKNNFRNNTLEGFAESAKSEYIICNTLYENNKKIFETEDIFAQRGHEYTAFNNLVQEVYKRSISIEDIRTLARSNMWKTYWNANRDNVLPGSASDWTDDQRSLVNYSRMYDNVNEHPDCPEDFVIEDDDLLDGWFIYQRKKTEREKKQAEFDKKNSKLNSKRNKGNDAQEIFLMPNEEQSAKDIMDLNDPIAKSRFKQKIAFLNKNKGKEIEESQLPDVQMDIMNQRAENQRNNKR